MFNKTTKECEPLTRATKRSTGRNTKLQKAVVKMKMLQHNAVDNFDGSSQFLNDRFRLKPCKSTTFRAYERPQSAYQTPSKYTTSTKQAEDELVDLDSTPYLSMRNQLRATPNRPKLLGANVSAAPESKQMKSQPAQLGVSPIMRSTVKAFVAKSNLKSTPLKYSAKRKHVVVESERTVKSLVNKTMLRTPVVKHNRSEKTPISPPFSSARKALRKVKIQSPQSKKKHLIADDSSSLNFPTVQPDRPENDNAKSNDSDKHQPSKTLKISSSDASDNTGDIIDMQSIRKIETAQRTGQYSAHVTVFRVVLLDGKGDNVVLVLGPTCLLFVSPVDGGKKGRVVKSLQRDVIKTLRSEDRCIEITSCSVRFEFSTTAECLNFMHLFYVRRPIGTPAARRLKERRRLKEETNIDKDDFGATFDVKDSPSSVAKRSKSSQSGMKSHPDNFEVFAPAGSAVNKVALSVNVDATPTTSQNNFNSQPTPVLDPRSAMIAAIQSRNSKPTAANEPACSDTKALSSEDERKVSKYRQMLKMKVPSEAVRHKMKSDGIEERLISAALEPSKESPKNGEGSSNLSPEDEAKVAKYRKMLKMNVPSAAVQHKMTLDGIDQRLIDVVCSAASGTSPKGANTKTVKSSNKSKGSDASSLSPQDEKIVAPYRKMKKILPPGPLRHKMTTDGIDPRLIDAFFGVKNSDKENNGASGKPSLTKKPSGRNRGLLNLHWTPLSPTSAEQSFWGKTPAKKKAVEDSDVAKLEQLFSRKKKGKPKATNTSATLASSKKTKTAQILDSNRAQNITITLTSFNKVFESHDDLINTLADLDPNKRICGDNIQFMKSLLPKPEEKKALQGYRGNRDNLVPSEQFLLRLVGIKRIDAKIGIIQTMGNFAEITCRLSAHYKLLATVCEQIMSSEKLHAVLDTVLAIGNIMNEGTRAGGASGFKLESLMKLTETKSTDGKMTVLDYIVMTFVAKDKREDLSISEEFPDGVEVSRMMISEMVAEARATEGKLRKCEAELTAMRNEKGGSMNVAGSVMLGATSKRSGTSDVDSSTSDPRSAMLRAIAARTGVPEDADDSESTSSSIRSSNRSLDKSCKSPGISRLEKFVADSNAVVIKLKKTQAYALESCKKAAVFFGEKKGEQSAVSVIGVLTKFASTVEQAVKKHDARIEREKRQAASALKKPKKNRRISETGAIQLRRRRSFKRSNSRSPLTKESSRRSPLRSASLRAIANLNKIDAMCKTELQSGNERNISDNVVPTLGHRMERSIRKMDSNHR